MDVITDASREMKRAVIVLAYIKKHHFKIFQEALDNTNDGTSEIKQNKMT